MNVMKDQGTDGLSKLRGDAAAGDLEDGLQKRTRGRSPVMSPEVLVGMRGIYADARGHLGEGNRVGGVLL